MDWIWHLLISIEEENEGYLILILFVLIFGMTPYVDFYELNPDSTIANSLQQLYGDINDVDAWVGMLAEGHMPDALFGETIMEIMKNSICRVA